MGDVSGTPHPITSVGWREWASLPEIGVPWIKAKIDTGARSSALHAFDVEELEREGVEWVRFAVHPWQNSDDEPVTVELPVLDRRVVRSSSGHAEERIVVALEVVLAGHEVLAEMTLSNRDEMGFRMLIGREALRNVFVVNPAMSYAGGRPRQVTRRKNRGRA